MFAPAIDVFCATSDRPRRPGLQTHGVVMVAWCSNTVVVAGPADAVDEFAAAGITLRVLTPQSAIPNPKRSGNLQFAAAIRAPPISRMSWNWRNGHRYL